MSDTAPVLASRDGDVLVVRLAAPARRNVIDLAFTAALADALADLDGVGAIAILADGSNFSFGGDVAAMAAADDSAAFVRQLADDLHDSMRVLAGGPPVVLGVRGWAAGAGMSMVCAADVVVAGESAQFRAAYPGIGVSPDGGMSWNLPRIVGARRARSLILRNAAISLDEAKAWGMVDEVVPDTEVDARTLEIARTLADGPRFALAQAKALIAQAQHDDYGSHLDAEAAAISACVATPDGVEGITAFVERRSPAFGAARP